MMPPPPFMMGNMDKYKEPKPKSIKEVPAYLSKLIKGFFSRLFYIYKLVWETRPWILFLMTFMSVFNGVMPVVGAHIGKDLINALVLAFTSGGAETAIRSVVSLLVIQFAFMFVMRIVNSIQHAVTRITGELVVNHIKLKIMNKAKDMDLGKFDLPEFYEKLENAGREADRRPIQILDATFNIASTLISMVSFIVVLWFVSPAAPFIIAAVSIPTAIVNFIYRRKNVSYMRRRSKDRRQMQYYSDLITNKDMVKELRLFGTADTFIGKFSAVFKKYFGGIKKLILSEQIWQTTFALITTIANCMLYLYIALKVAKGQLQVGDYSLYTGALNSIAAGITTLITTTATIYEGTLFINNMIEFMKEKKTIVPLIDEPLVPERTGGHTIELINVSFKYPGTERYVLKNINLKIRKGETLVLVGLNGSGKTTLIKLITRLYDATEGQILLDGEDIRNYDVRKLYDIFGIIFQDFGKYAMSVRENIAMGNINKPIDEENIEKAAEKADAKVFIEKLESKFDTPLMRIFEENGTELSIGQWQKLAVARAFYSDSDILILDEPTASLDPMAEAEIFSQFELLGKDKTTIFVSHRLSSATIASKIVVLKDGEIKEEGNHRELMERKGEYFEFFSTQARRYIDSQRNGENYAGIRRIEREAEGDAPRNRGFGDGHRPPRP